MDNNTNTHTNESRMEEIVGRIKEAAGVLFGNRDMKREGRADQWTGQAKSTASEAIDDVRESVESIAESMTPDDGNERSSGETQPRH